MLSLGDNKTHGKKPAKRPPSRGRRAQRSGGSREAKDRSNKTVDGPTSAEIRQDHDHLLRILREEAKTLNDPLLLYLYDMVIHRTEVGDLEP